MAFNTRSGVSNWIIIVVQPRVSLLFHKLQWESKNKDILPRILTEYILLLGTEGDYNPGLVLVWLAPGLTNERAAFSRGGVKFHTRHNGPTSGPITARLQRSKCEHIIHNSAHSELGVDISFHAMGGGHITNYWWFLQTINYSIFRRIIASFLSGFMDLRSQERIILAPEEPGDVWRLQVVTRWLRLLIITIFRSNVVFTVSLSVWLISIIFIMNNNQNAKYRD